MQAMHSTYTVLIEQHGLVVWNPRGVKRLLLTSPKRGSMKDDEFEVVQGLLDGDLGEGETQINNLLVIREHLWAIQMSLKERMKANDVQVKVLENLHAKCRASAIAQEYLRKDTEDVKTSNTSNTESLDLVDVDTFLRDNPNCTIRPEDGDKFMLARLKDEEQRRARLFLRKLELEHDLDEVAVEVERMQHHLSENYTKVALNRVKKPINRLMGDLDGAGFQSVRAIETGVTETDEPVEEKTSI